MNVNDAIAKSLTDPGVAEVKPGGGGRNWKVSASLQGMSPYGPPESYVGRLADLRGPKWPSVCLPTHLVTDVREDWQPRFGGRQWRITAYSLKDGTRCVLVWSATWLPRRCV
jgi:hypothetical protein